MNDKAKVEALKALLEDEEMINDILAGVDATEKQADQMGIAFKEYGSNGSVDLNALSPDELLDFAIAKKEAEIAQSFKADEEEEDEEEAEKQEGKEKPAPKKGGGGGGFPEQFKAEMDRDWETP